MRRTPSRLDRRNRKRPALSHPCTACFETRKHAATCLTVSIGSFESARGARSPDQRRTHRDAPCRSPRVPAMPRLHASHRQKKRALSKTRRLQVSSRARAQWRRVTLSLERAFASASRSSAAATPCRSRGPAASNPSSPTARRYTSSFVALRGQVPWSGPLPQQRSPRWALRLVVTWTPAGVLVEFSWRPAMVGTGPE